MSERDDIWYRLGYALQQSRGGAAGALGSPRLRSFAERLGAGGDNGASQGRGKGDAAPDGGSDGRPEGAGELHDALDALKGVGAAALATKLLGLWPAKRRPGALGSLRGAAAGAAAALVRHGGRRLIEGRLKPELDEETVRAVASGAARGLLYAAVIEPRLPGSRFARALVYGGLEYAVSPWGGLTELLGRQAPHRSIPGLSALFEGWDPAEDTLPDHLIFAFVLGMLYGSTEGEDEGGGDDQEPR